MYDKAYVDWNEGFEAIGRWNDKVKLLGEKLNKATSDLNEARREYNMRAHQVLRYYELL